VLIQYTLKDTLDDSHVVNIAGRQRMLSQRITKAVLLLGIDSTQLLNKQTYQSELEEILPLWQHTHEALREGVLKDTTGYYVVKNSQAIKTIFVLLDSCFQKMYDNALKIKTKNDDSGALKVVLENEGLFLKTMNKMVNQYDLEARERVKYVQRVELFLFLLTIAILILEGLLVFRPLASYVKKIIGAITKSENDLQETNHELQETNLKLIETQHSLEKTTKEKYELVEQEHKIRAGALIEGQEGERKRIAQDLHDGIGQMLMALKLQVEQLKTLPFVNEKQKTIFGEHQQLINDTIEATRAASFDLMPAVLYDFGLSAALRILTEQMANSSGIIIGYKEIGHSERLSATIEINLYRIAQEALNNALKYAFSDRIEVKLKSDKTKITLSIADFGRGFDIKKKQKNNRGNGFKNIETRVDLLNGKSQILSQINEGTIIVVTIPVGINL
jgi:signal transduction histidine kinase